MKGRHVASEATKSQAPTPARRAYQRRWEANRRRDLGIPEFHEAECGTRSGYNKHRARDETPCKACREANTKYQRDSRARRAAAEVSEPLIRNFLSAALPTASADQIDQLTRHALKQRENLGLDEHNGILSAVQDKKIPARIRREAAAVEAVVRSMFSGQAP